MQLGLYSAVICQLICLMAVCFGVAQSNVNIFVGSGPVLLTDSHSSFVFLETMVTSDIECAAKCRERGCAVASLNDISGLCQLIVLNDASTAAGPPGTHVMRVVGAEAGDRVWRAPDFNDQLRLKRRSITLNFFNSSVGSNGTVQATVVNVTGCYRIEATGARGGSTNLDRTPLFTGGKGARMAGNFSLTAGTQLSIVVGQRGGDATDSNDNAGSGGGGGTFVYVNAGSTLMLAAGGGGGGSMYYNGVPGQNGSSGTNSAVSNQAFRGFGGSNGQPGFTDTADTEDNHAGSGAGWLGKANMTRDDSDCGDRGGSRADGWVGGLAGDSNLGAVGGFGGGGGGAKSSGASGGGGGFSGGGAGLSKENAGGGGGSVCGGSGCTGTAGGNTDSDQGSVAMELLGDSCV